MYSYYLSYGGKMKPIYTLSCILLIAILWFAIYKSIDPPVLEAKEVHGLSEETVSYAAEINQLENAQNSGKITSPFFKTQIEEILDATVKIRDKVQTSDFEQKISSYKGDVLGSIQNITEDAEKIRDGDLSAEIIHNLQASSKTLKEINIELYEYI
jgi:hypothetical protein